MNFRLQRVEFIPKEMKPGVIYFSEKYGAAAHLCACGCGAKVRTPIDDTEWSISEDTSGPSLFPSVGNWQQACRSHYIIRNGAVIWCGNWTEDEIKSGQQREHQRRVDHLNRRYKRKVRSDFWNWLRGLFG